MIAALTLLTLGIFHRQLFEQWTFPWDFRASYSATPAFVAATIGRGNPLSWTPFVASGFPVAISPQTELYFPVWWLLGALGIPVTLAVNTWVQVAHVLFGAIGMLAFARARQLDRRWAFVAAVAYLFFGGFYGESEHADIVRGFAYLPWLLWCLTPATSIGQRWNRLLALPFLGWLMVSGAYPAELISYGLASAIYVLMSFRQNAVAMWRRYRLPLLLVVAATGAIAVAVLVPYYLASRNHGLFRASPPIASVRAYWSITPDDLFGLYLNSSAWRFDGSVTSWAVGAPILMGLFLLRRESLRRHIPLVCVGIVGLFFAMVPKIGPIGRLMAGPLTSLFPSNFPAADYKAPVAIAVIILAVEAWRAAAKQVPTHLWTAVAGGGLLILGAVLAPSHYGPATQMLWLLVLVVAGCLLVLIKRPPVAVFALAVVLLVAVDGGRGLYDSINNGQSPWLVKPTRAEIASRDAYVRRLPELLAATPKSRPARVPPIAPLEDFPGGTDNDSLGWVADGYRENDYSGTIEISLHQIELNPTWNAILLAPWHAYLFPCSSVGCGPGKINVPSATTWKPSSGVRSLSYSAKGITYAVRIKRPMLMVENELALTGWSSSNPRVRLINVGLPFRAWRLSPGNYQFTATYHQPGSGVQELAALLAIVLTIASVVVMRRRREDTPQEIPLHPLAEPLG